MNIIVNVLVLLAVLGIVVGSGSPYRQCPGQNIEDLDGRIKVIPCGKDRCLLGKGTNSTVEIRFKPKHDVENLINDVSALVMGLKVPFFGVTGTSACPEVYHADTLKPAPCPLKAGSEYIYRNVFPIHDIYPELDVTVLWSLKDGNTDVVCFETCARIKKLKIKSG